MVMSNSAIGQKKSIRALLVDDDTFMLEFVADMLRDLGVHDVLTSADGKQGIAVFDAAHPKPDVILCDLYMPGKDGFQFMEVMADRNYEGGIILISGQEGRILHSAALMAEFHQLNILAAIEKPVTRQALSQALVKLR